MKELINIKIERIKEHIKILRDMSAECEERFISDVRYKGALLHYLYMTADSCISLAEMIIRDKGLRTPQSYRDSIDILGENNIIPPDFAYEFAKIASLRNFLAHDYEKIDYLKICKEALEKLSDIERYISLLEKDYQS